MMKRDELPLRALIPLSDATLYIPQHERLVIHQSDIAEISDRICELGMSDWDLALTSFRSLQRLCGESLRGESSKLTSHCIQLTQQKGQWESALQLYSMSVGKNEIVHVQSIAGILPHLPKQHKAIALNIYNQCRSQQFMFHPLTMKKYAKIALNFCDSWSEAMNVLEDIRTLDAVSDEDIAVLASKCSSWKDAVQLYLNGPPSNWQIAFAALQHHSQPPESICRTIIWKTVRYLKYIPGVVTVQLSKHLLSIHQWENALVVINEKRHLSLYHHLLRLVNALTTYQRGTSFKESNGIDAK
eukprot:PhF_6_TR8339/c0_g2_i1/m.13033